MHCGLVEEDYHLTGTSFASGLPLASKTILPRNFGSGGVPVCVVIFTSSSVFLFDGTSPTIERDVQILAVAVQWISRDLGEREERQLGLDLRRDLGQIGHGFARKLLHHQPIHNAIEQSQQAVQLNDADDVEPGEADDRRIGVDPDLARAFLQFELARFAPDEFLRDRRA